MACDPRIKRACPFCDEAEHLQFSGSSCPWPIVENGDTVKDDRGYDVEDYVDGVHCMVCHALVPLHVWNREVAPEVFAVLRVFDPPAEVAEVA
jgi:hypothetical protein